MRRPESRKKCLFGLKRVVSSNVRNAWRPTDVANNLRHRMIHLQQMEAAGRRWTHPKGGGHTRKFNEGTFCYSAPGAPRGNMARQRLEALPKAEKGTGKETMPTVPANQSQRPPKRWQDMRECVSEPPTTRNERESELVASLFGSFSVSLSFCRSSDQLCQAFFRMGRAVRRVKEATAVALVQRGLPEEWWDCAMDCRCHLRNVHEKMTDGKTALKKRCGQNFDGPSIPFGTSVEYIPITAKDKSRVHQFGKQTPKGTFLGCVLRAGGRLVRRLDDSRL